MQNNSRLLTGKVCLVTGAGQGIGRSIAERYAEEGAIVYANARKSGSIDDWALECSKAYGTVVIPLYFDITDTAAVKDAVIRITRERTRIDVLVNNAGVVINELIGMISREHVRSMFEVNVFALIEILQLVARVMKKQNSGSIINISSIVGMEGSKGQLAYSASKGAVISLTRSAAKELAPRNIRVNSVAPGMTETSRFHETYGENSTERLASVGMGRLARPEEIANACVFLASDLSEFVSGEILGVNGCSVL